MLDAVRMEHWRQHWAAESDRAWLLESGAGEPILQVTPAIADAFSLRMITALPVAERMAMAATYGRHIVRATREKIWAEMRLEELLAADREARRYAEKHRQDDDPT